MADYTAAVIGTGPDPRNPTVEGFAMGYRHAEGYRNHENCRLVACADVITENATAFADTFDFDEGAVFEDYEAMVADEERNLAALAKRHTVMVIRTAARHADRAP